MPGFINAEYEVGTTECGVRSGVDPTAMRNARNQPKTNVRCIQKLTPNGLFSLCAGELTSSPSSPPSSRRLKNAINLRRKMFTCKGPRKYCCSRLQFLACIQSSNAIAKGSGTTISPGGETAGNTGLPLWKDKKSAK